MEHRDRFSIIAVSCALLLTAGAFVGLHLDDWTASGAGTRRVAAEQTTPPSVQSPAVPEPATEAADQSAAEHVQTDIELASHRAEPPKPELPELPTDAVAAVAAGRSPELEWLELPTMRDVLVRRDPDGLLVVAAGTHRRYVELVDGLTAVPPAEVVRQVRQGDGLAVAVDGQSPFERDLRLAVEHLLEVEVSPEPAGMRSDGTEWAFADAELQALSRVQQHLLLMHRADALRLQGWLAAVHAEFGWAQAVASPELVVAAQLEEPEADTSLVAAAPDEEVVTTLP
jgi:hypothetical protein